MRISSAVATSLLLLTALPAAAKAPARAATTRSAEPAAQPASSGGGLDLSKIGVAGWIGGEFGDLDGFNLRAEAFLPIAPITPKIDFVGVAALGFTHLGSSVGGLDVSWNMVKLLAIGRAQMPLAPKLEGFADAGLGFWYGSGKVDVQTIVGIDPITFQPIYGTVTGKSSSGGFTLRLAAGGAYEVDPKIKLLAELGLEPYFGDAETTNFFISVGASMKL